MAKFYAKAPDGSDALLSIVLTGFTQSLQQNGWCKLPNGLLIQWQQALTKGCDNLNFSFYNENVYFNIQYSTACLIALVSSMNSINKEWGCKAISDIIGMSNEYMVLSLDTNNMNIGPTRDLLTIDKNGLYLYFSIGY